MWPIPWWPRYSDLQLCLIPAIFASRIQSHPEHGDMLSFISNLPRGHWPRQPTSINVFVVHHFLLVCAEGAQNLGNDPVKGEKKSSMSGRWKYNGHYVGRAL